MAKRAKLAVSSSGVWDFFTKLDPDINIDGTDSNDTDTSSSNTSKPNMEK